jgi:hypothetical protein
VKTLVICCISRVTEFDDLGVENVVLYVIVHNITYTKNFASAFWADLPEFAGPDNVHEGKSKLITVPGSYLPSS